jgi:hypothetical protein
MLRERPAEEGIDERRRHIRGTDRRTTGREDAVGRGL